MSPWRDSHRRARVRDDDNRCGRGCDTHIDADTLFVAVSRCMSERARDGRQDRDHGGGQVQRSELATFQPPSPGEGATQGSATVLFSGVTKCADSSSSPDAVRPETECPRDEVNRSLTVPLDRHRAVAEGLIVREGMLRSQGRNHPLVHEAAVARVDQRLDEAPFEAVAHVQISVPSAHPDSGRSGGHRLSRSSGAGRKGGSRMEGRLPPPSCLELELPR